MQVFGMAFGWQLALYTATTSPRQPSQRVDPVRKQTEFVDVGDDASVGASVCGGELPSATGTAGAPLSLQAQNECSEWVRRTRAQATNMSR